MNESARDIAMRRIIFATIGNTVACILIGIGLIVLALQQ